MLYPPKVNKGRPFVMLKLVEDIPLLESILYNKKARKPTMDKQSMMVRPS